MRRRPSQPPTERAVGEQLFRGFYAVVAAIAVGLIIAVGFLGIGLAQGYRPVVLTSGSMTPTAPTGSVVVARPVDQVRVGDILVMSNGARATVTHRVVEIETSSDGTAYAVTRGDANTEVDAEPYPLDGPQLVGRWILPGLGSALLFLGSPLIGFVVIGGAVLILTMSAISYIWSANDGKAGTAGDPAAGSNGRKGGRTPALPGQKRFALAIALSMLFGFTGLAWALYIGADTVPGNAFSTSDCFDADLADVQRGQVVSNADGVTAVTIAAVDPTSSFVTYSVRSDSTKPGDSVVLGNLASSTTIEFVRQTDSVTPAPVVIEWSVVEYACGVTVQRGSTVGNNTSVVDVVVANVDPDASFLVGGIIAAPTASSFENSDVAIVELVGNDTVRFRTAGAAILADQTLTYQLVEFDDAGDARTEVVSGTLTGGTTVANLTLSQPVALDASMVIASFATDDGGPDIGQRMVRARLVDSTTVEVQRAASADPLDVSIQVVQFLDGTTVQHGVVDLVPTAASEIVSINPIDLDRSTVTSTVLIGGSLSGGSTDQASSAKPGEAMATVHFVDPATISVERGSTTSTASFAWQVVTWGGPSWADPDSPYRQRVDVDAGSVDVPSGYTTSVTLDHNALVTSGLSSGTGDDLRLWRFDGTSWTELDRVIDDDSNWNDVATTFWFRTQEPVDAATTVSYWLYFGNQTPPAPLEDPNGVWLLDEGFEGGLGTFEDRTEATAWYRAEPWTRRIELTVDAGAVVSPLTDQPVLVHLTNTDLATNAQTDGSDIFFTNAAGTSLPHDIEAWNPISGTLSAWVRVDTIDSAADTTLFLYFGTPDSPAQADPRNSWAEAGAVWNMSGDPTGPAPALDDRGLGNIDGVALGDTIRVADTTGWSARLDGTTDRLEAAPVRLVDGALSVSAWFRPDSLANDLVLAAQGDPSVSGVFELGVDATTTPGTPVARAILNLDGVGVEVQGGVLSPATWHHVAMVWDGTSLELFVDGSSVGSVAASGALPTDRTTAVVLGGDPSGARTLDGDLGQVRLRSAATPAPQLAFEAANLISPAATVTSGPSTPGVFRDQGTWTLRRPLLVSSDIADADLADFPLLVQLVDSNLGAGAQSDGDDLVFTAADGVTRLDHHLESWDAATGAITAWVRIPLLSSTVDTELFVYLGNPTANDQSDPVGVWGADADLVLASP